jgi:hypothetical protein
MALSNRTKLGITLAISVVAGLAFFWLAVLLLMLAVFLIAWGQAPERTRHLLKAYLTAIPSSEHWLNGFDLTARNLTLSGGRRHGRELKGWHNQYVSLFCLRPPASGHPHKSDHCLRPLAGRSKNAVTGYITSEILNCTLSAKSNALE